MKQKRFLISLFVALFASVSAYTKEEQEKLSSHLSLFETFIGKTWKGELGSSTEEKQLIDVSRWEKALNGQAIRVLHSINDGEYGGETIINWNSEKESFVFYYFTTEGFFTNGTIEVENGKFVSHEVVTGSESGITEVKSTGKMLSDGRLHIKAQYLKEGNWVDGHEITYSEDPKAEVILE